MPSSPEQVKMNAFESFFATFNVRFAVLVAFKGADPSLEQDVLRALASCRLGSLEINQREEDWFLQAFTKDHDVLKTTLDGSAPQDYGEYLEERISTSTHKAEGSLPVEIVYNLSGEAVALLVNANHALVDGRSLTHFVALALRQVHPASNQKWEMLPPWRDLVVESRTEGWSDEPRYLPSKNKMLRILELQSASDLESTPTHHSEKTIRFTTDSSVMTLLKSAAKSGGSTITGILISLMMTSLATEYSGDEPRDVGVSLLVDLRPFLGDQYVEIPLAIGHVTLSLPFEDVVLSNPAKSVDHLIKKNSTTILQQLKDRIQRGEAHRCALALTSGNFEGGSPEEATLELSNLGVCALPPNATLYTAQRFDGYDGVSCMVHSEGSTGDLRWAVSTGVGISTTLVKRVFDRVSDLAKGMVAAS